VPPTGFVTIYGYENEPEWIPPANNFVVDWNWITGPDYNNN
jgi:hypothetical protein